MTVYVVRMMRRREPAKKGNLHHSMAINRKDEIGITRHGDQPEAVPLACSDVDDGQGRGCPIGISAQPID
jgi:hypothetical protein